MTVAARRDVWTAMPPDRSDEDRVLILAPWGRDAALAASVLEEAGLATFICSTPAALFAQYEAGAGAAVIAQEALTRDLLSQLAVLLARQPPWSDFPIIVFIAREAAALRYRGALKDLSELGNVTALERPIHPSTLVSGAAAALRARRRQYHNRDVLAERDQEVKQRDQFLAMLGHELRNPLAAIMNAKHLADRVAAREGALPNGTAGELERPLAIIDRQIRHLTQLVDDLLDVSRVTSGKIVLKPTDVDLVPLVRMAAEEVARSRGDRRIDLSLELPDHPLPVRGDPVRVEQIVGNILTNAFKYTPSGGSVDVTVEREGTMALFRVTDTGVGMSAATLSTIFEPFTQADGTLDRAQGGMGLGLTVVRSLVELHGGDVQASSAGLGRGSMFVVRLPLGVSLDRTVADRRSDAGRPVAGNGPSRRILIIEDSADIRESMQALLSELGHQVDVAVDGRQGVERAVALRPDVALVDIGLPLLDGYEVARRVRQALGPNILLVALTGYGQPDDQHRAHQAGFDLHFTKPIDIVLLHDILVGSVPAEPAYASI
jgi:signal transduction histidine kinase/CheY-like chemotaxis protein